MTQHEQHMEVYSTSILGVLQILVKLCLFVANEKGWISTPTMMNTREELEDLLTAPNKITELRNKVAESEKPGVADKYLKLYQASEDMVSRCLRVVSVMCSDKGVDGEDRETINAWSVVKDTSGNVLVTVDYWGGDGELASYQFPVGWLEWPVAQLETHKAGCQLHASV